MTTETLPEITPEEFAELTFKVAGVVHLADPIVRGDQPLLVTTDPYVLIHAIEEGWAVIDTIDTQLEYAPEDVSLTPLALRELFSAAMWSTDTLLRTLGKSDDPWMCLSDNEARVFEMSDLVARVARKWQEQFVAAQQ